MPHISSWFIYRFVSNQSLLFISPASAWGHRKVLSSSVTSTQHSLFTFLRHWLVSTEPCLSYSVWPWSWLPLHVMFTGYVYLYGLIYWLISGLLYETPQDYPGDPIMHTISLFPYLLTLPDASGSVYSTWNTSDWRECFYKHSRLMYGTGDINGWWEHFWSAPDLCTVHGDTPGWWEMYYTLCTVHGDAT